jgi:HEPN domain-containing protein
MPGNSAQSWLQKAKEDETVVAVIANAGGPYGIAAYHVQQAAEKYLKAALVSVGITPPRSHDLVQLLSLLSPETVSEEVLDAAGSLSVFAWMTRYPGGPEIESHDLVKAQQEFDLLKTWVLPNIVLP